MKKIIPYLLLFTTSAASYQLVIGEESKDKSLGSQSAITSNSPDNKNQDGTTAGNSGSTVLPNATTSDTIRSSEAEKIKAPAETSPTLVDDKKPIKENSTSANNSNQKVVQTKPLGSPVASTKKTMLYGRIEQIANSTGATFPVFLQPMQAKMDTRGLKMQGGAATNVISGSIVKAYPSDYRGAWGGNLTVWAMQMAPICWQIDPDEAKWTAAAIKPGLVGQVNFYFDLDRAGKVALEPAQIAFMVPMSQTNYQEQMSQLLGPGGTANQSGLPGGSEAIRQMINGMAKTMTVPMIMYLGSVQTNGIERRGVSGNQFRSQVVKNVIRELAPGVLEQQILTSSVEQNARTNKLSQEYAESVVRFTKQSQDQLYVQIASVTYTDSRQFKRKTILYGVVRKGQVVNNNPGPTDGLGQLFNRQNGMSLPSLPQLKPGENPFQNLFPH